MVSYDYFYQSHRLGTPDGERTVVCGVFSTKELAEAYCEVSNPETRFKIKEIEVDAKLEEIGEKAAGLTK